jgi:hypothetical protein
MSKILGVQQPINIKNYLINGNFDIWQRGTSTSSNPSYLADRWVVSNITSASQQTDVPPNGRSKYSISIVQTAASFCSITQRIESFNSLQLNGKQVTFSFWAKSFSGSSSLYVDYGYANAVDNFSSTTPVSLGNLMVTPSSSWTQYSLTFTVTANMATNGMYIMINRLNTSASETRITQCMLNEGPTAAPFQTASPSVAGELALCQRYYWKRVSVATNEYFATAQATSTTNVTVFKQLPVPMRTNPTVAFNTFSVNQANGATTSMGATSQISYTPDALTFNGAVTGMVAGNMALVLFPSIGGSIAADAEL